VALKEWTSSEAWDLVDASHDAYETLPDPVRHRRRVLFVKPRFWVVIDDLLGRDEHDLELRFQFAAGPLHRGPNQWVAARGRRGDGLWLAPFSNAPLTPDIREGETSAPDGWVSTHYGRRHPAPMLAYSTRSRLPVRVATLLIPAERIGSTPPAVDVTRDAEGRVTAVALRDSGDVVRIADESLVVEPAMTAAGRVL
jgi:hypothetical protein